jgi:flagellin
MPLNSVHTNAGAMVALQSLNKTSDELTATQKRISTGFRVADAKDDGAAYAVAERVRGEIAGTASANEQLGGVKGLLDVTNASLSNVSDTLKKLKTIVVKLADQTITADQQAQYQSQAKELTNNIQAFIQDAGYNGKNILDESVSTLANTVVRNGSGTAYSFNGFSAVTNVFNGVSAANAWTAGSAAAALTAGGALTTAISNTLTQLNNFGSYSNFIDSQINYNKSKMDAQEGGLGALVDADLARESAKLQSLQIRQQLGTQALSIANQAPQTLLSLFR